MTAEVGIGERCVFSVVTSIAGCGPCRFDANVSPEWTIGGKPNGGYLLAMLVRAAVLASAHDHPIAAGVAYLQAPEPGPARIEVELLRDGRSTGRVRARLIQGDRACVEALVTTGALDPAAAAYWDGGVPVVDVVPFDECIRLPPQTPDGGCVAILEHVDLRLEPSSNGIASGRPSGRGELRGWLALFGEEGFSPISLMFAVDAFPPANFDIEFSGWQPTIDLTVYIRAIPAPGPVRVLTRAHLIAGRRVDQSCQIWDRTGRLVAQATQLAGVLLG